MSLSFVRTVSCHKASVPLLKHLLYLYFISVYLILNYFIVPCCRIWGDFPWFRVLGFGVIFRGSAIPDIRVALFVKGNNTINNNPLQLHQGKGIKLLQSKFWHYSIKPFVNNYVKF